ncbi:MAG: peptidyl-tRNA hydrolase [Parcubacteria group bacterium Gr01-1014_30]|nr:MAG: peptidyl-tRNA hydrolase [Parcubacteria group bacterium Gr01-1014_30]
MVLIVGLGNPGKKFEKTRHNIGARVIDELECLNLKGVILAKPTTFMQGSRNSTKLRLLSLPPAVVEFSLPGMNDSGKAVKKLVSRYKLHVTSLYVIHDDLDLPLGKLKISLGRGSAGHKGVQSIIDELGTKNFVRFRIGIKAQNTRVKPVDEKPVDEKFVLGKFTKGEERVVKEVIKKTCQALEFALKEGVEKAMSEVN